MSIVGSWNTTTNTPMGAQQGVLTINADGTGKLSGAQGDIDISGGTVDGDSAQFSADVTSPMPITLEFDCKCDGDTLTGNVKLGAFGNATVEGTRA